MTCSYLLQLLGSAGRAEVLAEARRLLAPRPSSRLIVVTIWAGRPLVLGASRALRLDSLNGARI